MEKWTDWAETFAGRTLEQLQQAYDNAEGAYEHLIELVKEEQANGHYQPVALLARMEELEDCLKWLRGKLDDHS